MSRWEFETKPACDSTKLLLIYKNMLEAVVRRWLSFNTRLKDIKVNHSLKLCM